jgi:hypothetical protein
MNKVIVLVAVIVLAVGCRDHPALPFDLTSASDDGLMKHLDQIVTMTGRFSLRGKLGPFIEVGKRPIYLKPKASFSWGDTYAAMEGREVRVTGVLKFFQSPEVLTPKNSPIAQVPDHFYFVAETAKIELLGR